VDEHVLPAIIPHDEAEALLRVEKFDDSLAFADDLRGHSAAACAAAAEAASTTAAAAEATSATAAAAEAAAVTVAAATAAAEAATVAVAATTAAATTAAAAEAAALLKTAKLLEIVCAETFALVAAAPSAFSFAPFIETHIRPNSICPLTPETNALGQKGATGHGAQSTHAPFTSLQQNSGRL
jgi:hypothetical protein